MARQLGARGIGVGLLAMIDSEAPEARSAPWWDARVAAAYLRNLGAWVVDDDFFRSSADDKLARVRSKGRLLRSKVRSLVLPGDTHADIRDVLGVWRVPAWQ